MDTSVSVLGLGAMGSALAHVLLVRGHPVTVWNRTPDKARDLVAEGAVLAGTPADAVAAGELVLLSLTDYDAVQAVLGTVADAVPGRVVVNLTTGAPDRAEQVADWARRVGADYLDGVVQAGPEQLGGPEATLLYSGSERAFVAHRRTLEQLGTTHHLGPDAGQACRYDLALLGLWYEAELAYLNALALVGGADNTALDAFATFAGRQLSHVSRATAETAREVRERRYPRGPASLVEHAPVLEQLSRLRSAAGLHHTQLVHLHEAVRRRIDRGHGTEGLTGVIEELAVPTRGAPAR
ncbi:NAD(P)-dependent oxidoreductase [Plantactinospora soyae]|uniref:3-hydroxyisobutyrate dehydrogenase-like beta-hydroxyacid dehydrogenase n=1 Tax=Plantactinospora soyae TaxID=1544732 RepID=A0A927MHF2_9ACTN|nr:NAD(P)-binding domain-containing protein [Plantactinospora soyae]MBE1491215.1 3-hydroxyisobutyrate dehydrogenase-like beta-hydroxyacid dehydrogenase [Plantactinospora soyae]